MRIVYSFVHAAIAGVAIASAANAAEMLSAAHASITAADASRHVAALADDSFEGREGGTRGGRAAGAYVVNALEPLGFEPAGDGGSYFQPFGGMRNILALVPGSDPAVARELVVVSAHYDHVGYGNARNSYGPFGFVHNGADDNASGVAGLIEVAEALRQLPVRPRRPILIAFWDGEEKGLLGSAHFLRVRPAALADHALVFCINLDMIGRLRGQRLEVYGARTAAGLRSFVVAHNNGAGMEPLELFFDWRIDPDSDHYSFIQKKIPTLMFHTGLHDNYHRPSDDVHLVNFAGIEPVTRLTLACAMAVADDPAPPRGFRDECRSETDVTRRTLEAAASAGTKGRWGIGTRGDTAEPGAPVIVRVAADSPAARAGLIVGDRLLMIDGEQIADQADMVRRLAAAAGAVRLRIDRRGRLTEITMSE